MMKAARATARQAAEAVVGVAAVDTDRMTGARATEEVERAAAADAEGEATARGFLPKWEPSTPFPWPLQG